MRTHTYLKSTETNQLCKRKPDNADVGLGEDYEEVLANERRLLSSISDAHNEANPNSRFIDPLVTIACAPKTYQILANGTS